MPTFVRRALPLATLALIATVPASAGDDPIVTMQSRSELVLDLGMVIDDLLPPLLEAAALDDPDTARKIRKALDLAGLTALDRLELRSSADETGSRMGGALTLKPGVDGGLLGSLFAVPPGRFEFSSFLRDDEYVLAASLANVASHIAAVNDFAARPELRELAPMIPVDPLGMTAMWGVDARRDILPHLSGEVDFVLFPFSEGQRADVPNLAIVLGLQDGPAFREKLLEIVGHVAGAEQAAALRNTPGTAAGEYTFYPLQDGLSYAVGPDFGIITTDPERLKQILARGASGTPSRAATLFVRLDGDRLVRMVEKASGSGGDDWGKTMARVLQDVGRESVGAIEFTTTAAPGRCEMSLSVPRSLLTAEYRLLRGLVAAVPEARAQERRRADLRGVLGTVDKALTSYGEDHEDVFPESLDVLVAEGYLDAVPDLIQPTPAGEYRDGGYSYLTERADGEVVGYYLLVYGISEDSGWDVLGPDSLSDPAEFRVAPDGKPDGVVTFAYGGTAIPKVREALGAK